MQFSIRWDGFEDTATIALGGVVSGKGCGNLLWEKIHDFLRDRFTLIVLDVAEAEVLDQYALEYIKEAYRLAPYCRCKLTVVNAKHAIRAALTEIGLRPCLHNPDLATRQAVAVLAEQSTYGEVRHEG